PAVLLARLGSDPAGARPEPARPGHWRGRHGREARLAPRRRDNPRRSPGAAARAPAPEPVRIGAVGGVLPDPERVHAPGRGGAATACTYDRRRRRPPHREAPLVPERVP